MTRYGETEADDLFRFNAYELGYLDDVHEPGNGRGLRAYYRDLGMIQPEAEREILGGKGTSRAGKEVTGMDIDAIFDEEGHYAYNHCSACRAKNATIRGVAQ